MADYTKDSIFEKNLLMLLPFYIMRYEKKGHDLNNNPELFQVLLNEYEEIRISLEEELTETGKSELYTDLTKLIVKISDYIRCEMTSTSVGGEQQISISGGSQSPI